MIKKQILPAIVWKEGKLFVAKTVGLELASQGSTRDKAVKNLQEALDLLMEDEGIRIPRSVVPQELELKQVYA